jgi:hypothetical protein
MPPTLSERPLREPNPAHDSKEHILDGTSVLARLRSPNATRNDQ